MALIPTVRSSKMQASLAFYTDILSRRQPMPSESMLKALNRPKRFGR